MWRLDDDFRKNGKDCDLLEILHQSVQSKIRDYNNLQHYVDEMLEDIMNMISIPNITYSEISCLAYNIDFFMFDAKMPWIRDGETGELMTFLIESWGLYVIPTSLEELWSLLPLICSDFKEIFDYGRDASSIFILDFKLPEDGNLVVVPSQYHDVDAMKKHYFDLTHPMERGKGQDEDREP